jgi:hypothetical protein
MDMEDPTKPDVPEPDRVTYNTVLKALRNGDRETVTKAEKLLERMEELGRSTTSLLPDTISYSAVLTAVGRSDLPDKAERVLKILQRMIVSFREDDNAMARPNLHCFNAALNACAFTLGSPTAKMHAFAVMVGILVLLQQYATADHMSYGTILRACSNLLSRTDERRDELAEKVFVKACREGQVSEMALTQLKFAASPGLYKALLQEYLPPSSSRHDAGKICLQDVPKKWRRNVRPRSAKVGSHK